MNTSKIRQLCDIVIGSHMQAKGYYDGTMISVYYKEKLVYQEFYSRTREVSTNDLLKIRKALLIH